MQHYYYRSNRKTPKRRGGKSFDPKSLPKLIGPFIILLVIIAAFYLVSGVYNFIVKGSNVELASFSEISSVDGEVFIKSNDSDFTPVTLDTMFKVGDVIQSRSGSKVDLLLNSGVLITLNENSELVYTNADPASELSDIFDLNTGSLSVDSTNAALTKFAINLDYINFSASNVVAQLKASLPIEVALKEGDALIDILDLETSSSYDEILLVEGKKFSMDYDAYQSFLRLETPKVISDFSPLTNLQSTEALNTSDDSLKAPSLNSLSPVKISEPLNGSTLSEERIVIKGTVPSGTEKVMVTSFENGVAEPYILKEFKANDTNFIYYAFYDDQRGNIKVGKNVFEVVAIDSNSKESVPARVEFTFENISTAPKVESAEATVDTKIDNLLEDSTLTLPSLVSINDQAFVSGMTLDTPRGGIVGKVPADADSVVVNGFPLKFYKKGDVNFNYILSEKFLNLKKGENKIQVYYTVGEKRSKVVEFIVNY